MIRLDRLTFKNDNTPQSGTWGRSITVLTWVTSTASIYQTSAATETSMSAGKGHGTTYVWSRRPRAEPSQTIDSLLWYSLANETVVLRSFAQPVALFFPGDGSTHILRLEQALCSLRCMNNTFQARNDVCRRINLNYSAPP